MALGEDEEGTVHIVVDYEVERADLKGPAKITQEKVHEEDADERKMS